MDEKLFAVTFAAIWMLAEMLIGSVLMIYGESIVERQILVRLLQGSCSS